MSGYIFLTFFIIIINFLNYAFHEVLHVFSPDHFAHLVCLS